MDILALTSVLAGVFRDSQDLELSERRLYLVASATAASGLETFAAWSELLDLAGRVETSALVLCLRVKGLISTSAIVLSERTHLAACIGCIGLVRRALGVGLLKRGQAECYVAPALGLNIRESNAESSEGVGDTNH